MSEAKRPQCPVCGRLFWCDYPNKWVYKRDRVFLCSWGCMRKWDERKEAKDMTLLTEAQKKKAISIAKTGESPYKYLKGLGVANPTTSWKSILNWARNKLDRNELEDLPKSFGQPKKAEAQAPEPEKEWTPAEEVYKDEEPKVTLVYDESIAEEYRREQAQKEANEKAREEAMTAERSRIEIQGADERDLWQTAAVRNKKMGTFYYDEKYRTIDWRHPAGEEISLPPEDWKWLGDHIGMILHALGVDDG